MTETTDPPADPQADRGADADTVARRAAQVITTMGADIRALTSQRDRYRSAWCSARERAQAYGEGILRVVKDREAYQEWLRQAEERVPAAPSAPADRTPLREQVAALAEDLRYVLNYRGPGHAHDRPGVWDTSGKPCEHCARLAVAQRNLTAYNAGADAVLSVLPEPADRAAGPAALREAAAFYESVLQQSLDPDSDPQYCTAVRDVVMGLRRRADETQQPETQADDTDPVYDPRAWETYHRDAGCGCTAPAPVDCKIPHGTGAWLCPCHRLSGPPWKDGDPRGTFLSSEDEAIRRHFQEPNRCLSANGIFRCSRPTGHLGDHRTGRTFWGRRAEDEQPAAVSQPGKEA